MTKSLLIDILHRPASARLVQGFFDSALRQTGLRPPGVGVGRRGTSYAVCLRKARRFSLAELGVVSLALMELPEGVLEVLHFLVTLPRRLRGIRQRRAIRRGTSGADVALLDIAMANKGRRPPEQRRGGMIRSGDLDVAIGPHLVISRERALVRRLELRGRLVFFRQEDGTFALYSLGQNMVQEHVLDASELSAAEWALFAEMVAEVTFGQMVIDPLPPFGGP